MPWLILSMVMALYRIAFGKGRKVEDGVNEEETADDLVWMKSIKELETRLQWTQNEVSYLRATQRKINKDIKCLSD